MSSNLFVRNNYFYPPMHHHCHGGNNFMNMMLGFSIIDMMWKNTFTSIMPQRRQPAFVATPAYQQPYPQQSASFYPYAQFSSQQNMSQDDQDLAGLRQMYSDCVINKIGNKYWARSQTFVISANSILELSYRLQNKVDEAMARLEAEAERARQQQEEMLAQQQEALQNGNQPANEGSQAEQPAGGAENPEQNTNLTKATDLKNSLGEVKYDTVKKGNPAVDEIINQYATKLGEINKTELKKAIINANPDIFDANGQLKDGAKDKWTNLQLPTLEHVRSTMGPSGWFASGNANSDNYKFDIAKLKNKGVQAILDQYQAAHGDSYVLDMEALKKDLIKNNQGIFNSNGKLINDNVKISDLRIPTSETVKAKYGKSYAEWDSKAHDNKNLKLGAYDNDNDFVYTNTKNYVTANTIKIGHKQYWFKNARDYVDSKGHFKIDKLKQLGAEGIVLDRCTKDSSKGLQNCRIREYNGMAVLIIGGNYFSLNDVMCGNVPYNQLNANKGNKWAVYQ